MLKVIFIRWMSFVNQFFGAYINVLFQHRQAELSILYYNDHPSGSSAQKNFNILIGKDRPPYKRLQIDVF